MCIGGVVRLVTPDVGGAIGRGTHPLPRLLSNSFIFFHKLFLPDVLLRSVTLDPKKNFLKNSDFKISVETSLDELVVCVIM